MVFSLDKGKTDILMNVETKPNFMLEALKQAKLAFEEGEIPVGAVLVSDGKILARGHNTREKDHDISGHAEIVVMKKAAELLGRWSLEGCSLYVTLEPCLMCAGAIMQSRIRTLVYGARDEKLGAITSNYHIFDNQDSPLLISQDELSGECKALLDLFFAKQRK